MLELYKVFSVLTFLAHPHTSSRGCLSRWGIATILVAGLAGFLAIVLFISATVLVCQPSSYTSSLTAQTEEVNEAGRIDPFWYNQVLVLVRTVGQSLSATLVNCSSLVSRHDSANWSSIDANVTGNWPLNTLEEYSYMVTGSFVIFELHILTPGNGAAPTLFILDNWKDYRVKYSSGDELPSRYVTRYPISSTGTTTHNITINSTGLYFFLLHFPSKTDFYYEFWVDRFYYSRDDYSFNCSGSSSCHFSLDTASTIGTDVQCLMVMPLGTKDEFIDITTQVVRNPINTLTLTLILLMVAACLVSGSALIYPQVQSWLGPRCSGDCQWCPRGSYTQLS